MIILDYIWYIFILLFILLGMYIYRNDYTYNRICEANDMVTKYLNVLIYSNNYDWDKDYYSEMVIDYFNYLHSFRLWGKYSAIKPEYKKLLMKGVE